MLYNVEAASCHMLTCCMNISVSDICNSYELMVVCSDSLNDDDEGISDVQHPEYLVCGIINPCLVQLQ